MTLPPLRLWLFVKKSNPAPLLFEKLIKTPAEVHSDTPAHVHHLAEMSTDQDWIGLDQD